jgi:hypothetical protein
MLVAQTRAKNLTLLRADTALCAYGDFVLLAK